MNETVISWTPQNWITVLLMVILGSVIIGAVAAAVSSVRRKASGE
jgi:hypothetical protein